MGLPKRKNNINVYPGETLLKRREELLKQITDQDSRLPEPILHADLDKGFLEFVKENFRFELGGNQLNMVNKILTIQRWGEISSSNDFLDLDEKLELPFIAVVKRPDVQFGTNPSLLYTIPNRYPIFYQTVMNFDGNRVGADIYKLPQPIPIDLYFDVYIVTNRLREVNEFNRLIMRNFSSRQGYTTIKGHYVPIVLDNYNDDSPISSTEQRRFYKQVYTFNMQGFLIDDEEFEVTPAINRHLLVTELMGTPLKTKITDREKVVVRNLNMITERFISDGKKTTYTTKDKLNILFYVSLNGQVLAQDVDFFHNFNTSNIVLNFTPSVDDELIVKYSNNINLTDIDGNLRSLVYEQITLQPNENKIFLNYATDSIILFDVNGQLQNQGNYFNHTPNTNEIDILQTFNGVLDIQVKYIPLTNTTPGSLTNMNLNIVNFTTTTTDNEYTLTGDYIVVANVTINNQPVTNFTFNNNTIILESTPIVGSDVRIIYYEDNNIINNITPYDFYTETFIYDQNTTEYTLSKPIRDFIYISVNGLIVNNDEVVSFNNTNNSISFNFTIVDGDEISIKYLIDN